jgi:hypothetical protein
LRCLSQQPVHVRNRPLQFHQAIHLPQKPTYGTVDILRNKNK